jgi:hypothetical protein
MPEAALDLDYRSVFRQNYVRTAGELGGVKTVSKSEPVKCLSHEQFRLGVF